MRNEVMKQYIDKSALVAEIKRRLEAISNSSNENNRELAAIRGAQQYELINLALFIGTLEVEEVDLESENENNNPKITIGTKIRSKTNPDVILSIISNDCHGDERIRKWIKKELESKYVVDNIVNNVIADKALAWLEKQKDANALIQEASEKAYTEGMRVERKHWLEKQGENILIEEIKRRKELFLREKEKAVLFSEKLSLSGRIAILEELLVFANEKQDEQKSISDTRYEVKAGDSLSTVEGKPFDYEHATITQKDYAPRDYNDIDPHFGIPVENLMSKEKTAEKEEPKFHEGDWIIHHGTENIYQVVAIIDNQYQLKYGDNYTIQNCADVDRCARLWNIEKKELKKLTQSVTKISDKGWSEEDEEELGIAIEYLQQAGQWDSATWLKSLKTKLGGK